MFEYFVVFAEMRTGSNFLEANLNEFDDLICYGEVFNPHFIGQQKKKELFGVTLEQREAAPLSLIKRIKENSEGLPGFRFFNDHDPRVMEHVLEDPKCAKIVLTRNPLESYVSLKIAAETGQWKLTDLQQRRAAQARFDPEEFKAHLSAKQDFQLQILRGLQTNGQSAFYIAYEDIQDVEILNGLARWLGSKGTLSSVSKAIKKQNPSELEDKVSNFTEMQKHLADYDHFALGRTPNFEPRRGPGVPGFVAAKNVPLLYIPIRPGPADAITDWLGQLGSGGCITEFSQKSLRQWMRDNTDHRIFTVLSHPLDRAHDAFCRHVVPQNNDNYADVRRVLRNRYGVAVPNRNEIDEYTLDVHRGAFVNFLKFLKGNLSGQTSVRVDPIWASQSAVLEAAASVALPDQIIRKPEARAALESLAERFGADVPEFEFNGEPGPYRLSEIYDEKLEKLCFSTYRKDYITFGFSDWDAS